MLFRFFYEKTTDNRAGKDTFNKLDVSYELKQLMQHQVPMSAYRSWQACAWSYPGCLTHPLRNPADIAAQV